MDLDDFCYVVFAALAVWNVVRCFYLVSIIPVSLLDHMGSELLVVLSLGFLVLLLHLFQP